MSKQATISRNVIQEEGCYVMEFTFTPAVNMRAWHTLRIRGDKVLRGVDLVKWIAWHLPYRMSRMWR